MLKSIKNFTRMKSIRISITITLLLSFFSIIFVIQKSFAFKDEDPEFKVPPSLNLTLQEKTWLKLHPVITVGCDSAWAPAEFIDSDGNYAGMSIDYLQILSEMLNVKFEIVKEPSWQQLMLKAKNGEIDLFPNIASTQERQKFLLFTEPYITFPILIYTHKNSMLVPDVKELLGKKVAIVENYATHEWLTRDYPSLDLVLCETIEEGLSKVANGEAYAYMGNMMGTGYHIRNKGYVSIKVAGKSEYVFSGRMGVYKQLPVLYSIIQKALNNITTSQRDNIYTKWITVKYEQQFNYQLLGKIVGLILFITLFFIWSNIRLRKAVKKRTQELSESEKQYRTLFETAKDGMFILKDDVIVRCNTKAANLFGFEDEKAILGRHIYALSPEFQANGESSRIGANKKIEDAKKGKSQIFNWIHKTSKDVLFHAEIMLSPIELKGVLCVLAIIRDITDKIKTEKEIIKAKETMEELYQLKNNFITNISYEIRTPMNGILGFADILNDSDLSLEEKQEYVKTIEKSAYRTLNLFNDLADISKIESGNLELNIKDITINNLIDYVQKTYKIQALAKGIKLIAHKGLTDAESIIPIDKECMNQVFSKLITNALKFTESGEINFGYVKKHQTLEFFIQDTGLGIKPEMQNLVFSPFKKASSEVLGENKGAGLGLSIAKLLIEKHGGEMWLESEFGKGSTFYFTLPCQH